MSVTFDLTAESRSDEGKGASRRLRREGKIPAVIYGGEKEAASLSLDHDAVLHALENEAFYSHILNITVGGEVQKAILKDVQRHPFKPKILHLDLLRVDESHTISTAVPIHFLNEASAPGVKAGGKLSHLITELEIECLPSNLPEFVELDLGSLDAGDTLHITDIALPEGVKATDLAKGDDHDLAVVTIKAAKGGSDDAEEETAE
tara:strand:- start:3118 stop:3732 length:615 start_codon:yes stop_codon:yes gene_type:complete